MTDKSIRKVDVLARPMCPQEVDHTYRGHAYHLGMRPITDIRRARLRQLIDELFDGNQAAFAESIGKSRAYVGFWLADPAKPHAKQISHATAREVEAKAMKPAGWLDVDEAASQSVIPDPAILGIALTSVDKVARDRLIRIEGQMGVLAPVVMYAYALAMRTFAGKLPVRGTVRGDKALDDFDRKVAENLGEGIESGSLGPLEYVAGRSKKGPIQGKAKSKAAGRGRT
ncbi:hypothetical protein CSC70_03910 [Pseudoxanthomonas kalamensis DSM 18571]|nr:hypothetical protein CSC70_03910 [Pseudoxanthomonas kalamensis DSM 18571]